MKNTLTEFTRHTMNLQLLHNKIEYLEGIIRSMRENAIDDARLIQELDFKIARREVIIRFLATGKADEVGEPIVKES
jgi:hypothetical protein